MGIRRSRATVTPLSLLSGEARPDGGGKVHTTGTHVSRRSRMSDITASPEVTIPTIEVGKLAPWTIFFVLLATIVLFFISADQGAVSIPSGNAIHEWVHDGRHLLGFPCH